MKLLRYTLKLVLLVLPWAVAAQDTRSKPTTGNLLQIISPVSGTVVRPGQTVSVTVTSNVALNHVAVLGEPIGISNIATSLPAVFSLSIPKDTSCRRYTIMAVGTTVSGLEVKSPEALIDVERSDSPTSLSTLMPAIEFDNLGETFPVKISATFLDGSIFEVTESSKLVYRSSNIDVAAVDSTGMVTALGVGKTTIEAIYGGNVHIAIPITVTPQALEPSANSLNFASEAVGIRSNPQQISLTNKTYGQMRILEPKTTGDFSEENNCRSLSPLAPGSSCTIDVTFTPTEMGLRKGSLSISDSFNGTLTISLSGTATTSPK